MKTLLSSIIIVLSITCFNSAAHSSILIGNIDSTGSYIITAPTTQLDSIFLNQAIFDDWVPYDYEITYDSVNVLYHLQAKGGGIGPNLGKIASIRVYLTQSAGVFAQGSAPPGGVAASETCTGNPCSTCKFLPSGGCFCGSESEGVCNHTITR